MALDSLDRTLRLMRDDPVGDLPNAALLDALLSTRVVLVADRDTLRTHSARAAFAACAQLAARSGAQVHLVAPDVDLGWPLPPIRHPRLIGGLLELGQDLVPGRPIVAGAPAGLVDVAIIFDGTRWTGNAELALHVSASRWGGRISAGPVLPAWVNDDWPLGGLAAAGLAATEIFKCSMRRLAHQAGNRAGHVELFGPVKYAEHRLGPEEGPVIRDIGALDVVSCGAIAQAALFAMAQIPDVRGALRLIDPDRTEASNMNRYMFVRRSTLGAQKVDDVGAQLPAGLRVAAVPQRFGAGAVNNLAPLAPRVLVGVDDIPSRWTVQAAWPGWLGIGATTHYCAMVSHHAAGLPCARCLHPRDDEGLGPIPTAAFVSFWAGLMLASSLLRTVAGSALPDEEQQAYFATLRPDGPGAGVWRTPVAFREDCPLACRDRSSQAA